MDQGTVAEKLWLGRRLNEDDGDGEAVPREEIGKLHHWGQMADAKPRVHNHRFCHHIKFLLLGFMTCQAIFV